MAEWGIFLHASDGKVCFLICRSYKARDVYECARCILLEVLWLGNPSGHVSMTHNRDFFLEHDIQLSPALHEKFAASLLDQR